MNKYIIEFRERIIRCVIVLAIVFGIFFLNASNYYTYIASPIVEHLPNHQLIATAVTTTFMVPLKLSFFLSILVSAPYIIYQLWSFISPGLYKGEKRKFYPYLFASCGLFYLGIMFAYLLICPLALKFFIDCAPRGVTVMTDINHYWDFLTTVLLAGGVAFQIPVITHIAIKFDFISKQQLKSSRPIVIVVAFVLGMLLTPPDVVSQVLLAVPMWFLFEVGLWLAPLGSRLGSCTK